MTELEAFKAFDVSGGAVNVWVFKKSQKRDTSSPTFVGRWVDITDKLEE